MKRLAIILLPLAVSAYALGQAFTFRDPAWIRHVLAAAGGGCTIPYSVTSGAGSTNDTTARSAYISAPAQVWQSNVLYLCAVVAAKANPPTDPAVVTNSSGQAWTKLGSTNFNTLATPTESLSLWSFQTNVDVASSTVIAGFSGNQTGYGMAIIGISNAAAMNIGDNGTNALVQYVFRGADSSADPSNVLASVSSPSNAIVLFAGNGKNGFGGTPPSTLNEIYDGGINTPATGTWAGTTNANSTSAATFIITSTASPWATVGVETKWQSNAVPGIRYQPIDVTVSEAASASLTNYAVNGCIGYQWTRTNFGAGTFTNIPSATSATYTIATTVTNDTGHYACVVTNYTGSMTSSVAKITVNAGVPTGNVVNHVSGSPTNFANATSCQGISGASGDTMIVLVGWENTGTITGLTNDVHGSFTMGTLTNANGVGATVGWLTCSSTSPGGITATVSGTCDFRDWYIIRVSATGTISVTNPARKTGTGTSVSVGTYNTACQNGLLLSIVKVDNSSTHASEQFGGQAATENNITGSSSSGFQYTHTAAQSGANFTDTISASVNWASQVVSITAQ